MTSAPQVTVFGHVSSTGVGVLKGLLYAVGGHDGPLVRKSCEVYDPTTNSWRQVADMNMCRRNAGSKGRPPGGTLGSEKCVHFLIFLCVCVCAFRCLHREQLTVRGGRRRWQLQSGVCGVLQSGIRQVDAGADLHEHRTQLRRYVCSPRGSSINSNKITFLFF